MTTKSLFLIMTVASCSAAAQDIGRVISSTPVKQHVTVPRQVCTIEQSGAASASAAPQCVTRGVEELQTVAYNVVYEMGGKQYAVQLPYAPGSTLSFQSPAAADANGAAAPVQDAVNAIPVTPVIVAPPYYYYDPFYPPIGFDFRFGWRGHGHGHGHGH